jgi:RecA/RadA recombinase
MTEKKTPEEVLREIRKQIPGVKIHLASDPEAQLNIQSFGIPELDQLCRGMLCGGYTTLWGAEKAGKSSIMARTIAQCQADGRTPLLVDLENRADPVWLALQGIEKSRLHIIKGGQDLEACLNAVNALVREGAVDAVFIDSITSKAARGEIMDKKEKVKGLEDDTIALIPKKLSQWFRIFTTIAAERDVPAMILSQVRMANLASGAYADKSGGKALRHYGSTDIKVSRTQKIEATKGGVKRQLGYWMRAELKKTSLNSNEGQEVRLPFYFGIGIDNVASSISAAINDGIVKQGATSSVTFQDKTYRSENQLVEKCRENPELGEAIRDLVANKHAIVVTPEKEEDPMAEDPETVPKAPEETDGYVCEIEDCGQVVKTAKGLKIHQTRTHKGK